MGMERDGIEFDGESFSIDAALLAKGFSIGPALVQPLMREGKITSRCERGAQEDSGRYRLTFFHERRKVAFVVDATGRILERSLEILPRAHRVSQGSGIT